MVDSRPSQTRGLMNFTLVNSNNEENKNNINEQNIHEDDDSSIDLSQNLQQDNNSMK